MSDTNGNGRNIPALAPARTPRHQVLDAVLDKGGTFDVDAWHVMNERDNALVADEILNGVGSAKFVYQFEITKGHMVEGISVVGARHMAAIAGQIRHRIVASVSKTGALHVFTQYPGPDVQMMVNTAIVHALAAEEDYYEVVIEITDLSNGNSIQQRARESKVDYRRDGSSYDRPHYDKIADAKAYRNGVLALIRQDIQLKFRQDMLKLGKTVLITDSVLDQKRSGVLRYAARSGIAIDRDAVRALTMDQILGMSEAANEGRQPAFVQAATALGLLQLRLEQGTDPGQGTPPAAPGAATAGSQGKPAGRRARGIQPTQDQPSGPRDDIPPNDGGEGSEGVTPPDATEAENNNGSATATTAPDNGQKARERDAMQASLIIADINRAPAVSTVNGILGGTINKTLLERWEREWPEGRAQVMSAAAAKKTALETASG